MSSEKSPAFQFYPRDFLADVRVAVMPPEAVGAYIRLLSYCWCEQQLESDTDSLRKLTGCSVRQWARIGPCVMALFDLDGNCYRHKRLDEERDKQRAFKEERSDSGKRGAKARWRHGSAIAQPMALDSSSSASASASAFAVRTPKAPVAEAPGFPEFWDAYPHKVGKAAAEKAWRKLKPNAVLFAAIQTAVLAQSRTWTDKKYIPHPASWLNGRRWEDELQPTLIATTPEDFAKREAEAQRLKDERAKRESDERETQQQQRAEAVKRAEAAKEAELATLRESGVLDKAKETWEGLRARARR